MFMQIHEIFRLPNAPGTEGCDHVFQIAAQKFLPAALITAHVQHQIPICTVQKLRHLCGLHLGVEVHTVYRKVIAVLFAYIHIPYARPAAKLCHCRRNTPFVNRKIRCGNCQMRCSDAGIYAIKSNRFTLLLLPYYP